MAAAPLALVVRVERTQVEFGRISRAIGDWLEQDEAGDRRGQHQTQRLAVKQDLEGAISELKKAIGAIDLDHPPSLPETYDTCRVFDESLVLLGRLKDFYCNKFDQRRDGARLGPLLEAADELVWSCHRRAMERAAIVEREHRRRPAPLAYIAAEYSPAALESDKPLHGELRFRDALPELDQFLDNPAIPVLRLPPWCVDDPWWLAFIAHEVGHHVQHDLDLVRHFREAIEQATHAAGAATAQRWGGWGQEIFADLFSILMIGPAALRALVEIEWAAPATMNKPRSAYPPALVRLELMARFAGELGMDVSEALPLGRPADIEPKSAAVSADLALVDAVLACALAPLPRGLGTLVALCGFDTPGEAAAFFGSNGPAADARKKLQAEPLILPQKHLDSARAVASGAVLAWSSIVASVADEATRAAALDRLRASTRAALCASGPDGTRAGQGAPPKRGALLAQRLLETSRRRLE